jgi:hypothetical protein
MNMKEQNENVSHVKDRQLERKETESGQDDFIPHLLPLLAFTSLSTQTYVCILFSAGISNLTDILCIFLENTTAGHKFVISFFVTVIPFSLSLLVRNGHLLGSTRDDVRRDNLVLYI